MTRAGDGGHTDRLCEVTLEVVASESGRTAVFVGDPDQLPTGLAP